MDIGDGDFAEIYVAGEGEPLICLHGFPDTPESWLPFADALAPRFQAIMPVMRGLSDTMSRPSEGLTLRTLAADVIRIADAMKCSTFTVIGQDWGAVTAYAVAALFPNRVRVCIALDDLHPDFSPRRTVVDHHWGFHRYLLATSSGPGAIISSDAELVPYLWEHWSPRLDARSHIAAVRSKYNNVAVAEQISSLYREAFSGNDTRYGFVKLPTLAVGCLRNEANFLAQADYFESAYRSVVLEDVGHFVHLERPSIVANLVLAFVTEASSSF